MKLTFGKRVLMFLHWFLSLIVCALTAIHFTFPQLLEKWRAVAVQFLGNEIRVSIAAGAFLLIYLLFMIIQICLIFSRDAKRSDRGFISVDNSETGKVRIAISAVEQMVRQAVDPIDGIASMKIAIENADEAIAIFVTASVFSGCHVPTITMNMQQAIRKFVELNCGVRVHSVSITINTMESVEETGKKQRGRKVLPVRKSEPEPMPMPKTVPATYSPEPVSEPVKPAEEPVEVLEFHEPTLKLDTEPEPSGEEPSETTEM